MRLQLMDDTLTVCRLADLAELPLNADFYFIGKTDEELSLVCKTADTPPTTLAREDGWKGFRIQGTLDFSLIGILSKITTVLAKNNIGLFAVSTYNTDYILVKEADLNRATLALIQAGYSFT